MEQREDISAEEQKEKLLPLIMEEKAAFIKSEYGRLSQIMGEEYTENGEAKIFHPFPEDMKPKSDERIYGNPEELTLEELAMLPHLAHVIERCGTYSTMPLIQLYPEDINRMRLLADMYQELMTGAGCSPTQIRQLMVQHAEYMFAKQDNPVKVIRNT